MFLRFYIWVGSRYGLDLDKNKHFLWRERDDIDFTPLLAVIALNDPIPILLQKPYGNILPKFSGFRLPSHMAIVALLLVFKRCGRMSLWCSTIKVFHRVRLYHCKLRNILEW